jgi:hypothetical protein
LKWQSKPWTLLERDNRQFGLRAHRACRAEASAILGKALDDAPKGGRQKDEPADACKSDAIDACPEPDEAGGGLSSNDGSDLIPLN